ncbi:MULTISPECIES: YbhB/YbcL family Raf kinase inhibitor-like protein [unclassified Bacillus (in: firmicutes)]|uniref:YbhB/YbcL family Raf kinase inhibitor-like protein n=1 Tax=unclassified Bacillus (in: firmicutes) TaxID=185979 RepID=UPI0004224645|nr:YbhB/YbcL family Raf kinase inhibitor-like protein [Bacillus sp. NSP9.1]QHZ45530.1 YbhB/YbcL family Raf kinase inhibitor-like protein [Bacillus sp. NSP9.1]
MNIYVEAKPYLHDKYSKYAKDEFRRKGHPFVSFPIGFEHLPKGAKTIALTLIDHDAIPVCGFSWIHWTAANIPADIRELPEHASEERQDLMIQGQNSFASELGGSRDPKIIHQYCGPTPPDKDHFYTLTVYALDAELELERGFYLNDLYRKIKGHILAVAELDLKARV